MADRVFHIVDVFAEERYSGNQLAVFLDGHLYTDALMQQLAKEMNFSETTFIFPQESRDGQYRVRIFTPAEELPFAGHPTLGTAFIIAQVLIGTPVAEVRLDLPAGRVPVALARDPAGAITRLTMTQLQPTFGPTVAPAILAPVLGLVPEDMDARYPIQEVSTGLPFLIVPLKRLATMRALRLDARQLGGVLQPLAAKAVLVYCPETYHPANQLNVRVFVPFSGIPEDPATGSANGCLTAYLLHHNYLGRPTVDIRVEQGIEIGRPSILYLRGQLAAGHFQIEVGGNVQHIAVGRLVE
ncbi:MAG TPA: PhzF family phenazine biosynthesis protein [Chloroflexia bacterium]|nr:PhzF family phenazine biosynthesis protein [Chloroflexia bacterium]